MKSGQSASSMLEYRIARRRASQLPTAEAALIAGAGNKLVQNVMCNIAPPSYAVNDKVGGWQREEWKHLGHARNLICA